MSAALDTRQGREGGREEEEEKEAERVISGSLSCACSSERCWFSCTLVSDKKASWKYGNVQSPSLVSILAADFNKPEQVYMELYFSAVQNMITPTLICITECCVI